MDSSNVYINWFWIIIAVLCSAIPLPLIKLYLDTNQYIYIVLATLLSIVLVYSYVQLLRNSDMMLMYPFIKILSIVLVVIIGVLFFGGSLTLKNIIGIGLGIMALYLLST